MLRHFYRKQGARKSLLLSGNRAFSAILDAKMAKAKKTSISTAAGPPAVPLRRSARNVKRENEDLHSIVKQEEDSTIVKQRALKRETPAVTSPPPSRRRKRVKVEDDAHEYGKVNGLSPPRISPGRKSRSTSTPTSKIKTSASPPPSTKAKNPEKSNSAKEDILQAKKLKSYSQFATASPYPDFRRPTAAECELARRVLERQHGERERPTTGPSNLAPTDAAGCGASPSVLDALVRRILSQNTSSANSTRAKRSMDAEYGGSDRWEAIAAGGQERLQRAIESGGLAAVKSRVILSILEQAHARYGAYSLDHLFTAGDDDAMRELISFRGLGPKTASCVLLFCLGRQSFAVDTHVHRITGLLGWRPPAASRDETYAHLNARIPDEDKYALHVLLVTHGRVCEECRAGGKSIGKCELRKAFKGGVAAGDAGEDLRKDKAKGIRRKDSNIEG